ncbi:MAG: hypothetical protein RMH97_05195 [Verrucomicrobiales bacterium]|nr:hypothetical protein [Verrucomicrobiales bacterium]
MLAGCATEHRADLVIINGTEPETLDPAIMTGFAEMRIAQGLFEGLTRPDPQTGQPVPGLAESWETSPDGCTYTFRIRSNACVVPRPSLSPRTPPFRAARADPATVAIMQAPSLKAPKNTTTRQTKTRVR